MQRQQVSCLAILPMLHSRKFLEFMLKAAHEQMSRRHSWYSSTAQWEKGVMQVLGEGRRWAEGLAVEAARQAAHRDERTKQAGKAGAGLPAARRQLHKLAEVRPQLLGAGRLQDQHTELSHSRYSTAASPIVRQ